MTRKLLTAEEREERHRNRMKNYRIKNKERLAKYSLTYYSNHKDKINARRKELRDMKKQ